MIFNEGFGSDTNLDNVKPSPYELGLEGALMHVYENECNYNAIIKSVGLAEMKYYAETGRDLFVNEAGAASGFFAKIKAFFKKVIEKIQAIFKKFLMVMNQYTMSDRQFANKYEKDVVRASLKDFEFKGYTFAGLDTGLSKSKISGVYDLLNGTMVNSSKYFTSSADDAKLIHDLEGSTALAGYTTKNMRDLDSDDINDITEKFRGEIADKNKAPLTESEFRDELKDKFYGNDGEKEVLDEKDINVRQILSKLKDNKKTIKTAEDNRKEIERNIKNAIKEIEKIEKEYAKTYDDDKEESKAYVTGSSGPMKTNGTVRSEALKVVQHVIRLLQNLSNINTIAYGMLVQALKDRARQNKAICVKLVGRKVKDESYSYGYGSYDTDGIFSDVVIR